MAKELRIILAKGRGPSVIILLRNGSNIILVATLDKGWTRMEEVFRQITMIVLLTLVGFATFKLKILNSAIKASLTKVVLQIAIPSAIIASGSLSVSGSEWMRVLYIFASSVVFHLTLFLFMKHIGSKWYPSVSKGKAGALSVTFGNVMFVGYPIVTGMFGAEGLFLASIFTAVFNFLIFTVGRQLLTETDRNSFKSMLLTPFNLSFVIMLALLIFQIKLPVVLQETLQTLGGLSTPLSLLTIGCMIAQADFSQIFNDRYLALTTLLRCLVVPLVTLTVMRFLPFDIVLRKTVIALSAMPVAATTVMLCEQHDCEAEFSSFSVAQSTIVFTGTFPLIMYLTDRFIR